MGNFFGYSSSRIFFSHQRHGDVLREDRAPRKQHDDVLATKEDFLQSIMESLSTNVISNLNITTREVVLLVGVSGGCDSVGLLHALMQLLTPHDDEEDGSRNLFFPTHPKLSCTVHVVHFNHKQRGAASDGDCLFVQNLCEKLNVPCHVYEWQQDSQTSFSQDKARQWRRSTMYELLQSLCSIDKKQEGVILTAHHRDDSDETILLKLLRGVHLTNLAGMESVMVHPRDMPNVLIARPMLNVGKADIVDFLRSQNLKWREDESNASDKYLRNRVRNELIPILSDMMGGSNVLQKRLDNVSQQSRELKADLASRVEAVSQTESKVFMWNGKMDLVTKEALYLWANNNSCQSLPYDQLQRICTQLTKHPDELQWTLQVGGGWSLVRNGVALSMIDNNVEKESTKDQELVWTKVEGTLEEEETTNLIIQLPNDVQYEAFVLSNVERCVGASFTPPWRHKPIKVRDFLRGQRVPLHLRGMAPVIVSKGSSSSGDDCVVAVFVDGQRDKPEKWFVDTKFSVNNRQTGTCIRLQLDSNK